MSLKYVVLSCLFGLTLAQFPHSKQMENMRKQFPIGSGLNVQSVDLKEITKAARHGRTIGSCHNMNCDVIDSQLRNLESVFEIVENFVTTIYNSVAGSLPFR